MLNSTLNFWISTFGDPILFNLWVFTQFTQWLTAKTVHSICDCNPPSIQLCSLPSGFLHFSTSACIRPSPNCTIYMIVFRDSTQSGTLPNRYLRIFAYELALGTCPNRITDPMVFCASALCLHQTFVQTAQTTSAYICLCTFGDFTQCLSTCVFTCLHQVSTRTAQHTLWLIRIC